MTIHCVYKTFFVSIVSSRLNKVLILRVQFIFVGYNAFKPMQSLLKVTNEDIVVIFLII